MTMFFLRVTLITAAALGAASDAIAQTWTGGAGNGNWNSAGNWSTNAIPVSSTSTAIVLSGTLQANTVQNFALPFVLNSLALDTADSAMSFTVSGNGLVFDGAGANITLTDYRTGSPASNALRIDSAIAFNAATSLIMGSSAGTNPPGYELVLNGSLSGSGGLTVKNTAGTANLSDLLLAGRNGTMTGTFTMDTSAGNTLVYLGNANALGRNVTINSGTSALSGIGLASYANAFAGVAVEKGYDQQLGNLTGSAALSIGSFSTGFVAQQSSTIALGFANVDATYAGVIRFATTSSHFAKVGTGIFTATGSFGTSATVTGDVSVRGGRYDVSGTSGNLGSTASSPTSPFSLSIYDGAEFRATTGTSSAGRLQNNLATSLNGGTLRFDASSNTNASGLSEVAGTVTVRAGDSVIEIDGNAGRTHRLSFSTLTNAGFGGTLFFQTTNLGINPLGTASLGGNVNFTTAPTAQLVGGTTTYGGATTNVSILPWGSGVTTSSGAPASSPDTFVTFDTVNNSVRRLETTNFAAAFGTATDNVSLAADANISGTANSLRITGTLPTITLAGATTLTSGALLVPGTAVIGGTGVLAFGTAGNATAYLTIGNSTLIQGPTISAANLSKNGAGTLTLNTAGNVVSLTATNPLVAVNAGQLTFNSGTVATTPLAASNVLTYQVSKGATLAVPNGLAIDDFKVLQGSGTVIGAVTVSGTGTIRPSALSGPSAGLASPGVLNVSGGITTFAGGGTYEWYINSVQGGEFTQAKILSNNSLAVTATAANKFNIKITPLQLSNAVGGPIYDADAAATYQWTIATFTGGITGNTDSANFNVIYNSTDFAGTNLSAAVVGNDVVLTMAPNVVPEPATILGLGAMGLGLAGWARRRSARRATFQQAA